MEYNKVNTSLRLTAALWSSSAIVVSENTELGLIVGFLQDAVRVVDRLFHWDGVCVERTTPAHVCVFVLRRVGETPKRHVVWVDAEFSVLSAGMCRKAWRRVSRALETSWRIRDRAPGSSSQIEKKWQTNWAWTGSERCFRLLPFFLSAPAQTLCVHVWDKYYKPFVKTARLESMLGSDEWLQLQQTWRWNRKSPQRGNTAGTW